MTDLLTANEPFVLGIAVPASLVLTAALALSWLLRRRAAGVRHALWTTTFMLLLVLPAARLGLPRWNVPVLPRATLGAPAAPAIDEPGAATELAAAESTQHGPAVNPEAPAPPPNERAAGAGTVAADRPGGPYAIFLGAWVAGSLVALLSVLVGAARFRALVRDAAPVRDHAWRRDVGRLCLRLGIAREVRVVSSDVVGTPMTGGWRRPVIVVPRSAASWPPARRRVVLGHELVHVRRYDALRQLLGRTALALHWFNPLSWLAARLATISREEACDEAVLALGTRPSEYASHLLDLAETLHRAPALASLPMVQRSQLERRVMAILAPRRPHPGLISTALTLSLVVGLGVSAAIARPVPISPVATPIEAVAVTGEQLDPRATAASTVVGSQEVSCAIRGLSGRFSGSLSMRDHDGGTRYEHSGWHNGDRIIQRYIDDLRLCMRTQGDVVMNDDGVSVRAIGSGGWIVLEAEDDDRLQRLVITEGPDGIEHEWSVDGDTRPFDGDAQAWRDRMFRVMSGYWEASRIRGQESSLRGQISSHRGQISSMRGQISSHRGQVSSMRGQISSQRGRISSLEGQISSHRGRVSSMRGQISSYEGQISSLRAAARATSDDETRSRLEREIEDNRERIREVERQIGDYDLEGKIAAIREQIRQHDVEGEIGEIQRQIDEYRLDAKVAEIQQQIEDYDLEGKIAEIERQIEELDADRRAGEIERRVEAELVELRRLIDRL